MFFFFQDVVSSTGFYNDRKIIRYADGTIEYPTLEAKEAPIFFSSYTAVILHFLPRKLDSSFKGFHFFCFSFVGHSVPSDGRAGWSLSTFITRTGANRKTQLCAFTSETRVIPPPKRRQVKRETVAVDAT